MTITITITTICMKMDDSNGKYHYTVDTYPRINAGADFEERFMQEYAGNGIESITVLQSDKRVFFIDTLRDVETVVHELRKQYDTLNETILDY